MARKSPEGFFTLCFLVPLFVGGACGVLVPLVEQHVKSVQMDPNQSAASAEAKEAK